MRIRVCNSTWCDIVSPTNDVWLYDITPPGVIIQYIVTWRQVVDCAWSWQGHTGASIRLLEVFNSWKYCWIDGDFVLLHLIHVGLVLHIERPRRCSFRKTTENRARLIFASDVGYFPIEQRHVCLYIMLMYWIWMQWIWWEENWDSYIFCSRCNVWNLILWIQLI